MKNKKVFENYSDYYDLLYSDKDYEAEVEYIQKQIKKYNAKAINILDLGCGTGKHDIEFLKRGFKVTGIELSEKMYRIAEKNKSAIAYTGTDLKFKLGDIRKLHLKKKFNIIVSLFHVMNYQTSNEDLVSAVRSVKRHLSPDGVFMFDFWYGPAVLQNKPLKRLKIMKDKKIKIRRKTIPALMINENTVDVNFEIRIKEAGSAKEVLLNETHSMRYLFLPELDLLFNENGMKLIHSEEWLTGKKLNEKSWSAFAVVKLK